MESRAATAIGTSGAFVTLLLAFITWESQQHHSNVPAGAKFLLTAGLLFLLISTIAGIVVGAPSRSGTIETTSLLDNLEEKSWNSAGSNAQRAIAQAQLLVLISKTAQNQRKARLLLASVSAQVLGVALMAFAALEILY